MNKITAKKHGKTLYLDISFTGNTREIVLEIVSGRNQKISGFKDISPEDRTDKIHVIRQDLEGEIWFPIVDVELVPGIYGQAEATGIQDENANCVWNGWIWPEKRRAQQLWTIPGKYLTEWENGCYFDQSGVRLSRFSLFVSIPVFLTISQQVSWELNLLCDDWYGTVTAYKKDDSGELEKIGTCNLLQEEKKELQFGSRELTEKNLCQALQKNISYIRNSRIISSTHPFRKGFYLFYDREAQTYRLPGWLWGWGPVIRLLTECADTPYFKSKEETNELLEMAIQAGKIRLKGQVASDDRELNGLGTARWDPNLTMEGGYRQRVCGASDSGFLCGWAWCRLYEITNDTAFLDAALKYSASAEYLMERYDIPPQDYMPEEHTWSAHTLDESGFGVKAFEALYSITGKEHYRSLGKIYIENHLKKFEREDGLWERMYLREKDRTEPCMFMTRGQGWAMEGLLSAWNLTGEERYKEKACRMARTVVKYQKDDGSWNFIMNETEMAAGIDDKGTPLWSLLLYRLYKADRNPAWLGAARKALSWCIEHQIADGAPEMIGGLASPTPQSGVVYRPWFTLSCLYTAGFFGLAILEELKLRKEEHV